MDPSLAESMGVNAENLLLSPPSSAENLLSMVNTLTRTGALDVIVVDSVSDQFLYMIVVHCLEFIFYILIYDCGVLLGTYFLFFMGRRFSVGNVQVKVVLYTIFLLSKSHSPHG